MNITDPIEMLVIEGLQLAGISFKHESEMVRGSTLDFHLLAHDVWIEVCQFYNPRKMDQMSRFDNAILIQGRGAAAAFVSMITKAQDRNIDVLYESQTVAQAFAHVAEECAEVLNAYAKAQRFGWDSDNPELPIEQRETNREWFLREIKDVERAIHALKLMTAGD